MSDVAATRDADGEGAFRPRTVALMLAIGIVGFLGMMVMGAYTPDLRSGRDGGAHALSNAATGFSGIVRLAEATGRNPRILRAKAQMDGDDLLVLTPPNGTIDISEALRQRTDRPTLFVLPKWDTVKDPDRRGWVRRLGLTFEESPQGVLAPAYPLDIVRRRSGGRPLRSAVMGLNAEGLAAPRPVQAIAGYRPPKPARGGEAPAPLPAFNPLLVDERGDAVLAQLGDGPLYVLADPDLLANKGLRDPRAAAAALDLLDALNVEDASGIDFDVTLNGFGHSPSPLKLAFEPPFVGMTLTLLAAIAMAGLHALGRFGPVQRRERAIAFGKAALVDNSAALVRKAGREDAIGERYATAMRDRARALFRAPARLRGAALDAWLDRLNGRRRFSDLAARVETAGNRTELVETARALHAWEGETLR